MCQKHLPFMDWGFSRIYKNQFKVLEVFQQLTLLIRIKKLMECNKRKCLGLILVQTNHLKLHLVHFWEIRMQPPTLSHLHKANPYKAHSVISVVNLHKVHLVAISHNKTFLAVLHNPKTNLKTQVVDLVLAFSMGRM